MPEKYRYQDENLEQEKVRLKRDLALLEATKGYSMLSDTQKELIRITLYLQARAERDMHPEHINDPWYYDWMVKDGSKEAKYQNSLKHIKRWNCHGAIAALERGNLSILEDPPENTREFFNAHYAKIKNESEIRAIIETIGYPCVVHVNEELGNTYGEETQWHSFLALGEISGGKIITWEKIGFELPYRVAFLSNIFFEYDYAEYWGFRKLRNIGEKKPHSST